MMAKRANRAAWGLAAILAGMAGLLIYSLSAMGDTPARVPTGTRQVTGIPDFGGRGYVWVTGDEIVFLTLDENDRLRGGRFAVPSGRRMVLPSLERRPDRGYIDLTLSPDGEWLLSMRRSLRTKWMLRELAGSRRFSFSPKGIKEWVAWAPDGNHWVELALSTNGAKLWMRTVGKAAAASGTDVPGLTSVEELLGIAPENHAIIRVAGMADFVDVDLGPGHRPARRFTVHPPLGAHSVVLSPDGRRLAWVTLNITSPPAFLTRFLPQPRLPNSWHVGVWLTDLDGRNSKEIVEWEMDPLPVHAGLPELVWRSDGKLVSWVWRGSLWLFPIVQ